MGEYKPYGTTNLAEFVAEAYSNPEFQRDLARINPKGGPFSAWQKFQEIIAKFFGFDRLGGTAQAEANRLIESDLSPQHSDAWSTECAYVLHSRWR